MNIEYDFGLKADGVTSYKGLRATTMAMPVWC